MRKTLPYRIIAFLFSCCVKLYRVIMGRKKGRKKQNIPNSDSTYHRYYGLKNQGATCYLNSVLQVLFMTKDFREAVNSFSEPGCIDHHLTCMFGDLQKNSANTHAITKYLDITRVHEQHDAAECLEKILHCTSLTASQIFKGELTHRSTCSECNMDSEDSRLFWSLPLTLVDSEKDDYSVMEGIKSFLGESSISGDDQIYCERCDAKTDSTSKCELKLYPQVLMLLLKRFKFDCSTMQYVKLKRRAQIPLILQIPHHGNQSQGYELYALVEHFGELRHGHYTATIRAHHDNRWYNFNDTSVTAAQHLNNKQEYIKSQTAYLLFYRRSEDTFSPDSCEVFIPEAEDQHSCDQDVESCNNQETPMRGTTDNRNVVYSERDTAKNPKISKQGKRSAAKDNELESAAQKVIKIETASTGTNFNHKQIVCDRKDEEQIPDQGLESKNCEPSSSAAEETEQNRKGGKEQKLLKRKKESEGEVDQNTKHLAEKNPNTDEENLQPQETLKTDENEAKEKEKRTEDELDQIFSEKGSTKNTSDVPTFKACTQTHSYEASVTKDHEEATPEKQCRADLQEMDEKSKEEPRQEKMTEKGEGTHEESNRHGKNISPCETQISKREDPRKANDVCSDKAEERLEQDKDVFKIEGGASASYQETADVDILTTDFDPMSLESPEHPALSVKDLSGKLQNTTETQSFDETNDGALKKTEALNSGKRNETLKKGKKGKNKSKNVVSQSGLVVPGAFKYR